ncbi:hypothetical protein BDZ94DRAFT_1273695 [Collybia nuda]|uniref:Uncharacterized protein n=1 Tax=Collybia nuda TaxID=64659 RepID=A0A9P5XVC4_9AGAR|nr:hypothetical protein BDZ94DRAFT_1273695 [Collybia nuda]
MTIAKIFINFHLLCAHVANVTAVRSYPLDQDLVNRFDETVDDKSDVYRLPDIKDKSASRIELSVEL